jgi:hypothetical protein
VNLHQHNAKGTTPTGSRNTDPAFSSGICMRSAHGCNEELAVARFSILPEVRRIRMPCREGVMPLCRSAASPGCYSLVIRRRRPVRVVARPEVKGSARQKGVAR